MVKHLLSKELLFVKVAIIFLGVKDDDEAIVLWQLSIIKFYHRLK